MPGEVQRIDRVHHKNIITFLVLADLHWGAMDVDRFADEIELCLFDRLNKEGNVDCIFIAGDLFDMKESFPSRTVTRVLNFLIRLMDYAEDVFVIEGTRGHDALQTLQLGRIFQHTPFVDRIHFYDKVTEIVYNGMHVLFIPEEYIANDSIHYKDYFSNHFDIIIGHGMVDKIWYAKEAAEREKEREEITGERLLSIPVFSVDKLCSIAELVYFGHVHTNIAYGKQNRFKYVGPMTRWEFDKEDNVGYYRVRYDLQTKNVIEEFIVNEKARWLITRRIEILEDYDIPKVRRMLEPLIDLSTEVDKLRIDVTMKRGLASFDIMKDAIASMLRSIPNIYLSFKFVEEGVESKKIETPEERSVRIQQYASVPEDQRVQQWVKEKRGLNVSLETIRDIIGYNSRKEEEDAI